MRPLLPVLLVLSGGCSEWHLFGQGQQVETDNEDTGLPDDTDEPEGCADALQAMRGAAVLLDDHEEDIWLSGDFRPVGGDSEFMWVSIINHETDRSEGIYLLSSSSWESGVFDAQVHVGIHTGEERRAGIRHAGVRTSTGSEGMWLEQVYGTDNRSSAFLFYASPPRETISITDHDARITTYEDDDVQHPDFLVVADLDGDGLDEAAARYRIAGEDGFYSVMTSPYPALWDSWSDDAWRLDVPREAGTLTEWPVSTDIDGDGYDDLVGNGSDVWGETYYDDGALWVLYGPFPEGRDLSLPDAALQNNALTSHLGWMSGRTPPEGNVVLTPGDVDGDGLDDLVFHALDHTDGQARGAWYVWTPEPGVHEIEELDRGILFSSGEDWSAWDAGDLNGDDQPDFLFTQRETWSTPEFDPDEPETVALLTSPLNDLLTEADLDHVSTFSWPEREIFTAMGVGDLTQDGLDDLVIYLGSVTSIPEEPRELLLLAGCEGW